MGALVGLIGSHLETQGWREGDIVVFVTCKREARALLYTSMADLRDWLVTGLSRFFLI